MAPYLGRLSIVVGPIGQASSNIKFNIKFNGRLEEIR